MGWKTPGLTADAVDTRYEPTGPGVRIFTDTTDYLNEQGVVEFTPGGARVTEHYAMNPRAENSVDSGGLRISGGSYGPGVAPNLDLAVIPNGDGSYHTAATLTGGPFIVDQPIQTSDTPGQWRNLPLTGAITPWDNGGNLPQYRRDAAGETHVRGIAKIAAGNTMSAGTTWTVGNLPAGCYLPNGPNWRTAAVLNASGFFVAVLQAWVDPGGAINVYNSTGAALGAGSGFCIGFSLPTT